MWNTARLPIVLFKAALFAGLAGVVLTFPAIVQANPITSYDIHITETDGGHCYRDYSEGGSIDDNCPVQLEIALLSQPGLGDFGSGGIPTTAEILAVASAAENYPSTRITVPSITYGGSYSGKGRIKDKRGLNDRCMFTRGLSGIDCYDGTINITEFTPQRLAGNYSGTVYKMNDDQETFSSTSVSGSFDLPMPALHDKRRPAGFTYQEKFREAFNLMYHMGGELEMANSLRALRDDGRGGAAGAAGPPCNCACDVFVRWQNWQVGRSCAPVCTLPEWEERRCDLECGAEWEACADMAAASPGLSPEMQALVEAMARQQGATSPAELRAIEDLVSQMPEEQQQQMMQLYGVSASAPSSTDVEQILDHMLGKGAPEGTRAAMRPSIEEMSPEDRAELLRTFSESAGQPMAASGLPTGKRLSGTPTPVPLTGNGVTLIPINPDWDAETIRYKAEVEQLGMAPDITEDAVEMFYNNAAPMRQQLWENVKRQLARKRQE